MRFETTFLATVTLAAILTCAPAYSGEFRFKVSAADGQWQHSGYTLAVTDFAEIRAEGSWKTHPTPATGPSGKSKIAGGSYAGPGLREGALLVSLKTETGSTVVRGWSRDDEVITFTQKSSSKATNDKMRHRYSGLNVHEEGRPEAGSQDA